MNLNKASLIISAVRSDQYPKDTIPEIALVGRSNVGKSSLINKLLNRRNFARTSSKPGKTCTINFYNIDDKVYFVDLPGYGFAKVSKREKEKWGHMIDEYLNVREHLCQIILLVDSRHDPTNDDITMLNWIRHYGFKVIVVATKSDKLSPRQLSKNILCINKKLNLHANDILIPFSINTDDGKEELWQLILNIID